MSQFSRQLSLKPQSLRKFFSTLFSDPNRPKGNIIEDDWECIEVSDEELFGLGEGDKLSDDQNSEFGDDFDDHFPYPSRYFFTPVKVQIKYKVLSKADILRRLDDKITKMCTVLVLSRSEAAILLRHFKWSVSRTQEEWLTCEEKVRKAVGLYERRVVETANAEERACGMCDKNFPGDMMLEVSCGHQFSRSCWTDYISEAISDGPGCLDLRCPCSSCDAAVGVDMIELLSSEEEKKKFEEHLITSYLNGRKKAKGCPAPGCDYIVFVSAEGDDNVVTCQCLYKFCWNCSEESHAPVECRDVVRWMSEMTKQSENWLLANTKPCPSCTYSLEQLGGCEFTRCTVCDHKFCWECGAEWSVCQGNRCYRSESRHAGYRGVDSRERAHAKTSLERFQSFYEEWANSESSRANAVTDLQLLEAFRLEILCDILSLDKSELDFLVDAQLQIAECHRLLKWTHVFGYYLPEDEQGKKRLLEFMQEQAKDLLNLLQKHSEELEHFLLPEDCFVEKFMEFRRKLITLTRVARNYFEQMIEALKTGLPEVVSIPREESRIPTLRTKMPRDERISSTSDNEPSPSQRPKLSWDEDDSGDENTTMVNLDLDWFSATYLSPSPSPSPSARGERKPGGLSMVFGAMGDNKVDGNSGACPQKSKSD